MIGAAAGGFPFTTSETIVGVSGLLVLLFLLLRERRGRSLFPVRRPPFRRADPTGLLLIALGVFMGQQLCGQLLVAPSLRGSGWGVVGLLGGLAIGVGAARRVLPRVMRPRGGTDSRVLQGLLVLWVALPVIYGAFYLVSRVGGENGVQRQISYMLAREPGWQHLALFAVFVAPLLEEIAFRGLLYPALRSRWGPRAALVTTSVLFGLVHTQANVVMPLAVLGVFLAYLVETTGSILPCVVAHAAFNALTVAQI